MIADRLRLWVMSEPERLRRYLELRQWVQKERERWTH